MNKKGCVCQNGRIWDDDINGIVPCPFCEKGNQLVVAHMRKTGVEEDSQERVMTIPNETVFEDLQIPEIYKLYLSVEPILGDRHVLHPEINNKDAEHVLKVFKTLLDGVYRRARAEGNYFFHLHKYDYSAYVYHFIMQVKCKGFRAVPYITADELLSLSKMAFGLKSTDNREFHQKVAERINADYDDYTTADYVLLEVSQTLADFPAISNAVSSLIHARAKRQLPTYLFSTIPSIAVNNTSWFLKNLTNHCGSYTKITILEADRKGKNSKTEQDTLEEDGQIDVYYNRDSAPEEANPEANALYMLEFGEDEYEGEE